MKATVFVSLLSLMASALAAPEGVLEGHALEKRCSNPSAEAACESACHSVVGNACKSCNGNPSCLTACENARYSQCYNCCAKKCATC